MDKSIEKTGIRDRIKDRLQISDRDDDLFACSRCGTCLSICPVYRQTLDEGCAPRGKLSLIEAVANGKIPFTEKVSQRLYTCTMCNYCTKECPSGVKVDELFRAVRSDLVDSKKYPEILDLLKERIDKAYNVTFDTNQGRLDWLKQIPDIDIDEYVKDTAEVVYFVGCVSSFSPRSFVIPRSITQILKGAGVDFTLLGEDEWCCGFPLLSSGMTAQAQFLAEHNIEMVRKKGAKILITSCPSCYHTWVHEYPDFRVGAGDGVGDGAGYSSGGGAGDFKIMHISQYLLELIKNKKIKLNRINEKQTDTKVTYHDPCDLGRNSGITQEPREVIRSIPGVNLVELPFNKLLSNCCGGGGNLESLNPQLAAKIAEAKAGEIISTGAGILVSACQQCERTLSNALKKKKSQIDYKIKVMDISELVLESIIGPND